MKYYEESKSEGEKAVLFTAIENGKFKLAKILILGKLKVSCKDLSNANPLAVVCRVKHYTKENERLQFAKFLIKEGAQYQEKDLNNKCAYDYAVENKLESVLDLFVEDFEELLSSVL